MKYTLNILLLFTLFQSFAQNQGDNWFFGEGVGIDFSTGTPVLINGGQTTNMPYSEGTSVISDDQGNLLFYTNGEKIWNANHQLMMNGDSLYGNFSTTQSSLIIPLPGSDQYFYVFTLDDMIESNNEYGLRYSIVDICLDNGLGGVIPESKNILLNNNVSEKLTACRHANGIDYWVLTQSRTQNKFQAYYFNGNGITDSTITTIGNTPLSAQGQMKLSSDGTKLGVAYFNLSPVGLPYYEVYEFNSSNGVISNRIPITIPNNSSIYGIEFSPDNSKLYGTFSALSPTTSFGVFQHDLSNYTSVAINNSISTVYQESYTNGKGLQLAPNGKIYFIGAQNYDYLISINDPNSIGSGCNVQSNAFYLGGLYGSYSLPSFVSGFSYDNIALNCNLSISAIEKLGEKHIIKTLDLMGRETEDQPNTLMIYIYSDGTTEKVYRVK